MPIIRGYRPSDLDAVYDICVRTADSGGDLRGTYSDDRLLGDVWAVPYVIREPERAYMLDNGTGQAIGYILGTADTAAFTAWYREHWLPSTLARFGDDPRDAEVRGTHLDPERMLVPELAGYPAHLHIDLLPEARGGGNGKALMRAFLDGLAASGVERVHLGMDPANRSARAFYDRLGFTEIATSNPEVTYLGRGTRF